MERYKIIDKLDELYEQADKNNIGSNETELEYTELVADWIETLVKKIEANKVISGDFNDWYHRGFKDGLEHRTLKCKCGKN